jgi:hypothetical protein|tara:strand:+ start:10281 stop:10403 length:123 start_codon:yes stop_codon:yes gene_type:complete
MMLHHPDDVAFLQAVGWTFVIAVVVIVVVCAAVLIDKAVF